ncbi:MAG TPA: GDP-mannose 4,6-dehydratase [Anaerolineales bacterium]|nr:GDP-mannose 4,6-dehydratase [Anaerolineales bacterium]
MTKNYLVTGGAGFIGTNYVARLIRRGERVTIYDNLSRKGASLNLQWLEQTFVENTFHLVVGDVRDAALLTSTARNVDVVVHLAGQVAVTTSVAHPREDFESNAVGTFNVLEAARFSEKRPIVLYASTNKVYGGMEAIQVAEANTRYSYTELPFGIPETYPLDFHSPYGCSKGTGDQYARDYHRIYGLPTVVFRQSCIYGPRQFGVEDQGWLAWFVIAAVTGKPITIYGDGKQVRDVLHVEDLMDAYDSAIDNIDSAAGQVFNLGGGPHNTLSVWLEFGPILESLLGKQIPITRETWRPGDQRIYVSDIRKAEQVLGWMPRIDAESGLQGLFNWVTQNRHLFS